jgi:hypothetical protein
LLGGAVTGVLASVFLWLPTYFACVAGPFPGGQGCYNFHYIDEWAVVFWIVGAIVPTLVYVKVEIWGLWVFVTSVACLTVLGLIIQIGMGGYNAGATSTRQGFLFLLGVLAASYAVDIAGAMLKVWPRVAARPETFD